MDISPKAIRVAKEKTEKEGIKDVNYFVCDTKSLKLTTDKYDVVFAAMSLHHFNNLENVFMDR
jgi:ubiquinone/menaquinone biosynthesis C-methylase UbiE